MALGREELERARSILAESGVPTEAVAACTSITAKAEMTAGHIAGVKAMLKLRWVSLPDLAAQLGMDSQTLESNLSLWFGDEIQEKKKQSGVVFVRLKLGKS